MIQRAPRPLPVVTAANRHFWCGGADGRLHILRCANGHWIHPYTARCPTCRSAEIAPQPVSGLGTVAGFTINHQPWVPGVAVPYVIAIIELAEQHDIRLMTNMPLTPIEDVRIGMPVKVFFEQNGDLWVPLFEAA